jgi:hypothetical protein
MHRCTTGGLELESLSPEGALRHPVLVGPESGAPRPPGKSGTGTGTAGAVTGPGCPRPGWQGEHKADSEAFN